MGAAAPGQHQIISHILHGVTGPKYLEVMIAKAKTQIREAENEEDRQRFAAYLDVVNGWKDKIDAGKKTCSSGESESR